MIIRRRKEGVPELNTTSTADISFMLLIFFLVASSMDIDKGITRLLTPADQQEEQQMQVLREQLVTLDITADNQLLLNGQAVRVEELRSQLAGKIADIGREHLIALNADPAATYDTYFKVQNEIAGAYKDVRTQLARQRYGKPYARLTEEQREAIRKECPQRIAEQAEE